MKQITELEKQILKHEFPQVSLSDDLDIERYFELRKNGRLDEALNLYNRKLKQKYPDENIRIELMSSYRIRSPRFQEILTESLIQLAEKTILKIKNIINAIVGKISYLNLNDVYSVVQECEMVVSAISKDRFAAISFTEKYSRYSALLNFKTKEMKKAAEIIRMYVTDTLSSVQEYKEEQALAERKQKALAIKYQPKKVFDFSKIIFTKEQKAAIEISPTIKAVEDKVIAFSLKYWNLYANSAFENAILLYSRKYKTNHFNIFQVIKIGRLRGWKDEEILQAVLQNVVSGYYYSISGDLYLQREWNKIKTSLKPKKKTLLLPVPGQNKNLQADDKEKKSAKTAVTEKSKSKKQAEQKIILKAPVSKKQIKKIQEDKKQITKSQIIKKKETKKTETKQNKQAKQTISKKEIVVKKVKQTKIETKSKILAKKSIAEKHKEIKEKIRVKQFIPPQSASFNQSSASIADIIMDLTNSRYKIHKGIFFDNIKKYIRKELDRKTIQTDSIFNDEKVVAENLIYEFFEKNYDNPFQNWETSHQYKELLKLGLKITGVENIIKDWAKNSGK